MKIRLKFLILIFSFSISSCKLNPPTNPTVLQSTGKVFVTSNIDSAEIILDNISTNKYTPDTIVAATGNHLLNLKKEHYTSNPVNVKIEKGKLVEKNIIMAEVKFGKTVLIEDFSNVSCTPCVASNKILEKISSQYSDVKVVKIKYATNFPSANDPFYLANSEASDNRIKFYNVLFTPTVWIDGIKKPIATDSIEIKKYISERLNETPKFNIITSGNIASGNYTVNVTIQTADINNLKAEDIYLHVVVIEKFISFPQPPGSNGETEFYDVMREMLPEPDGFSLKGISPDSEINLSYGVPVKQEWNIDKIKAVVFIQNKKSKEIYQASLTN